MKRIVWLLALAVVALSCETLMGGGSEKVDQEILQREHWSVCGMKAPREYQELNRFSYDYNPADEEDGYVGAEADFKDGKMTIVFPSGAAMPWAADYDLARIYYGPAWRLPTRAEAQRLIDECVASKHNRVLREDGEIIDNRTGIIFIPKDDTSRDFFMEVGPNEGDERGFWLADGSAFVGKIDSGNKVSVSIVTETAGKSYCVLPVKP